MKRYIIFAALGPFLGGFFLLIATTVMSGYWNQPSWSEVTKLFVVFLKTLQYSYLFGILPLLMIGAVDDIVYHVKRIAPVVRMLIVGVISFFAAELLYGNRGSDSGTLQFILYGLVGFVPAVVCSWLAHEAIDFEQPAVTPLPATESAAQGEWRQPRRTGRPLRRGGQCQLDRALGGGQDPQPRTHRGRRGGARD